MKLHKSFYASFLFIIILPAQLAIAGPVAQWHFDEAPGSATAFDSIGSTDGALAGDANFVAGGISGNAVSMTISGNGLVNMGDNFGFIDSDFSVVAWAKVAAGDETNDYLVVTKHFSTHFTGYALGINYNAGGYGQTSKAWFYDSNPSPGDEPISTTTVNDGLWHQIVGVYHKGGPAEIYVDGGGVEDYKMSDTIGASTAPFLVGGLQGAYGGILASYNGLVDEVQLYDHALSSNEVEFLFRNPSEVIPEPATICLLSLGALSLLRRKIMDKNRKLVTGKFMKKLTMISSAIVMMLLTAGIANGTVFNLANDWSDTQNPNGCWSLNYNDVIVSNHFYQGSQGFWGDYASRDGSFSKAVTDYPSNDWKTGDVCIHALSIPYDGDTIFTNVKWTCPSDGTISISGQSWDAYIYSDRDVGWLLALNDTVLAERSSVYSLLRTDPAAQFDQNLVVGSSLNNISVRAGDVVQFTAIAKTYYGHFLGVNMDVNLLPIPEPATLFLLGLGGLALLKKQR